MNYCVYNREFDQFLCLFNSNKHGFVKREIKWDDEFIYVLSNVDRLKDREHISTTWPLDTDDERVKFTALIMYRIVHNVHNESIKEYNMENIRFIPVIDGVPNFENESIF